MWSLLCEVYYVKENKNPHTEDYTVQEPVQS